MRPAISDPPLIPFTRAWWRRLAQWYFAVVALSPFVCAGLGAVLHLSERGFEQWNGQPRTIPLGLVALLLFTAMYTLVPLLLMLLPYAGVFAAVGWALVKWPVIERSHAMLFSTSLLAALPAAAAVGYASHSASSFAFFTLIGALDIWLPRRMFQRLAPGTFAPGPNPSASHDSGSPPMGG